jgi:hypothetical protein
MLRIRELRKALQEGEIVSAKYVAGSSTVVVTGRLGKSPSVPYLVDADGKHFQIMPTVTFPSGYRYNFASLDRATPFQRDEFLRGPTPPRPTASP